MNENTHTLADYISQYRALNTLYEQILEKTELDYNDQCHITDFYNSFKDTTEFDKAIFNLILAVDKEKQNTTIEYFREEINTNIEQYINNKDFLEQIDTKKIYQSRPDPIQVNIEKQLNRTNELWQKLKVIRGSLEAKSWQGEQLAVDKLTHDEAFYDNLYKEEQQKLDILYNQKKEADKETFKYRDNQFEKINELGNSFLSIIDNYFPAEKEKDIVVDAVESTFEITQEIDPNTIFRTGMYEQFLTLEQQLIKDNYLDESLNWIAEHDNKRTDIKSLIIFLVGLLENKYFLAGRDPKIKFYFENRYNIKIGQNFEEGRRRKYIGVYQAVFLEYKF